jgi:hypothetical protein
LVGLSEILEGRGGKINEDAINRKPMFDENSPEYAEGLNEFFRALQTPMNHAREEERVLKNKRYDELEVGGRLNDFDAEQGKKALKRIKFSNSDHNFYFFPQKKQR